jgi:hypothetical protein
MTPLAATKALAKSTPTRYYSAGKQPINEEAGIHTVAATDGADEASDQESAWDGGCCPAHSTNDGGHVSDVSRFRRVVYADDGDVGTALISIASEPRLDRQLCIDRVENPHLSRQGLHCHPSKQHATRTTWSWRQHGTR